jgi:hypothetical protein
MMSSPLISGQMKTKKFGTVLIRFGTVLRANRTKLRANRTVLRTNRTVLRANRTVSKKKERGGKTIMSNKGLLFILSFFCQNISQTFGERMFSEQIRLKK